MRPLFGTFRPLFGMPSLIRWVPYSAPPCKLKLTGNIFLCVNLINATFVVFVLYRHVTSWFSSPKLKDAPLKNTFCLRNLWRVSHFAGPETKIWRWRSASREMESANHEAFNNCLLFFSQATRISITCWIKKSINLWEKNTKSPQRQLALGWVGLSCRWVGLGRPNGPCVGLGWGKTKTRCRWVGAPNASLGRRVGLFLQP